MTERCDFYKDGAQVVCRRCGFRMRTAADPATVSRACGPQPQRQPRYAKPEDLPCPHRGDVTRTQECVSCGGKKTKWKVWACEKHEECTLNGEVRELKACGRCKDRPALLELPPAESPQTATPPGPARKISPPKDAAPAESGPIRTATRSVAELTATIPAVRPPAIEIHERPRVSIIIAARNAAAWLDEAIGSAFAQTERCEVVYADDASTDKSRDVARRWESRGLVILAGGPHQGVCAARNRGVAASRGEFLVHLDGDDLLTPTFAADHLAAMAPGVPFVYGPAQAFGDSNNLWRVPQFEEWDRWVQNTVNTSAMYARWAFEGAGRWQQAAESMWDWDLALRAVRLGTPRPSRALLRYRQHGGSWSALMGERQPDGHAGLAATIRRRNARLSLGSLVSGRLPELIPQWVDAVALAVRLMPLPEKPDWTILDNSTDPAVREILETALARQSGAFGFSRVIPWRKKLDWRTEVERRDAVSQLVAVGCQALREKMPGDLHWLIEDDVLPPPRGGRLLWELLTAGNRPIEAAAGAYRNRHDPSVYIGGWWNDGYPQEMTELPVAEPFPVDFTGTGCLMFWRDRTPEKWSSHVQRVPAHDWAWGLDLQAANGKLLLHPDVRCGHARTADDIIPG